jgi:hypothetical protein
MLEKIGAFLQGKKTYIVALGIGIVAALTYAGNPVPEWVWLLLNALGLGAIRSAIDKMKGTTSG